MYNIKIVEFTQGNYGIRFEAQDDNWEKPKLYSFEKNQIEDEFIPGLYQVKVVKKEFITLDLKHAEFILSEMQVGKNDQKFLLHGIKLIEEKIYY